MDMFTTRTMLGMIEAGKKSKHTWLRDRYFAYRPTFNTQKIDFDIVGMGGRKIAPFVNPKVGGIVLEREGYATYSFEAPELSPMRVTTAEDMLKRLPGETIYSGKSPSERAAEILGRDLSELDDIITRREEAMCAEALFTGKVTVKGEGYDEVIDFWGSIGEGEKPTTTLTKKWDATDVTAKDILADLRTIKRTMVKNGGFTPREMILGSKAYDVVMEKLIADQVLDNRRVDLGFVKPQELPNGVSYMGHLNEVDLDIYSYDEWYIDEAGKEHPMVPEKACLLASPNTKTMLAYGVVALAGDEQVRFYEGARVPDSWVQRANPSGRVVQIKSRPLPVIQQVNGFHLINCLS